MKALILGGIRSGKSRFAESLAKASGAKVVYVATATAGGDQEMQARIAQHQATRPKQWTLNEAPLHLAQAVEACDKTNAFIIVDCLTLWLTNLLVAENKALLTQEIAAFVEVVKNTSTPMAIVSNETNMGVVPLGELSRQFCDEAGQLHQHIAKACDRVVLMVAGLPMVVKGESV